MPAASFEVGIVGSGFAGSILARALNRQGLAVVLLERGRHPRFALGESSTPLASFCLERLARRYGLGDLHQLATHGRWTRAFPHLRRGLKRGFTFYSHLPGVEFSPGADNERRLLVAASPEDELADTHWLRADVDSFLARRAQEEGVELRQGFAVEAVTEVDGVFELRGPEGATVRCRFVIDATGPRGVVGDALGAGRRRPAARFRSGLVFGHFSGVEALGSEGLEPGPYPDERAAVHHLLEEGWVYALPFDHDCVSAGLVLDGGSDGAAPDETWRRVLSRYPSLSRQFAGATALRPLAAIEPLQHRRRRAAAARERGAWALLPHAFAFFDPLFSTGMAWSLLGVERLARAFGSIVEDPSGRELARRLETYDGTLRREAEQIERLIHGAGLARLDPRLSAAHAFLYFAAVSHEELRQRLTLDPDDASPCEKGFLGAGEPGWESLLEEAVTRLAGLRRASAAARDAGASRFVDWARVSIAPWNVIGLADPARRNLYPVDLEALCDRAELLGLSRDEMKLRLPLLRGGGGSPGDR